MQATCPRCGAITAIADEFVGRDCRCAHCGDLMRVASLRDVRPMRSFSVVYVVLLIIGVDTVGVLISLVLPAVQTARESARQSQCIGNLKQIGAAMHAYQDRYGCFPPAYLADVSGKPTHSWRVLILPFLGEHDLYARYHFDEPWNGPHNRTLAAAMPSVYRCPSHTAPGTKTSYAMPVGPHAISGGPNGRRMSDVQDGPSSTILVAEAVGKDLLWLEPRDLDTAKMSFQIEATVTVPPGSSEEISSHHPGRVNVLLCDGSVRTLMAESTSPEQLEAMMTIDGDQKAVATKQDK